ncbi:MAG: flagellar motor switch protein FliN [Chelatococcus sp.]|nr:MAG: flagellar motor switch protein FliN [Chelatococcus sp.]
MTADNDLNLPPLNSADLSFGDDGGGPRSGPVPVKTAEDLEQVFDVPVTVSAVLGSSRIAVGELLQIVPGAVLELDRRVGEAIDIFVNERLVARGEVVVVEDRLGVTMTEIIKADRG